MDIQARGDVAAAKKEGKQMSVEYKSTYKCDFCGKEIDVDNIKIFQAAKISKCRLAAIDCESDPTFTICWDICIDCATKLYKDGLSTVNGIIPKNQKVLGL